MKCLHTSKVFIYSAINIYKHYLRENANCPFQMCQIFLKLNFSFSYTNAQPFAKINIEKSFITANCYIETRTSDFFFQLTTWLIKTCLINMAFLNRISYKMTQLDNPFLQVMNIKSFLTSGINQQLQNTYMYVYTDGFLFFSYLCHMNG